MPSAPQSVVPLALLLALLSAPFAGCSTANVRTGPPELTADERWCMNDDECQITNFGSECCACKSEPYAINRTALTKKTDICSVVECKCDPGTDCSCPKVADPAKFKAVCSEGACKRKAL
jgi:hypothetical protein